MKSLRVVSILLLLFPLCQGLADDVNQVEIAVMSQLRQAYQTICADCRVEFRDVKIPNFSNEDAADLHVDTSSVKWGGSFIFPVAFLGQTQAYVSGQVRLFRQGLLTARAFNAVQPIGLEDTKLDWIDVTFLKDTLATQEDLRGAVTKSFLGLRHPIQKSDLRLPQLVSRGQMVKVIYGSESFEVETQMKAEDSGSLGDVIRVKGDGNRTLSVRITQAGTTRLE